jgi:hypothetical protein
MLKSLLDFLPIKGKFGAFHWIGKIIAMPFKLLYVRYLSRFDAKLDKEHLEVFPKDNLQASRKPVAAIRIKAIKQNNTKNMSLSETILFDNNLHYRFSKKRFAILASSISITPP